MAQTKRAGNARTHTTGTRRQAYIYDNTAHDLDIHRELQQPKQKREISHAARKNRDKARHMNLGYLVFLLAALCACVFILANYIQMQADLTNKVKAISGLESELNTLKMNNDENYNRITSSIDLEEIKRIAIGELGMVYAQEGQIITYQNEGNDYMRRVVESK